MINQVAWAEKNNRRWIWNKGFNFSSFYIHIIKSLIKLHIKISLYKKEEDWQAEEIISPLKFKEEKKQIKIK